MEDRELVIKLPEDLCNKIYSDSEITIYGDMRSGKTLLATLLRAIRNGVILPKGHGDLIDSTYEVSTDGRTIYDVCGYLAPTIIEADKESEEE